jgi:hypothetical protein
MGKASSAKKVARVARSGGSRHSGQRRNYAFPLTVAGIVLAGVLLVAFARSNQQASAHPQIYTGTSGDHWHAAYGFYLCDHFADPLTDGPAGDQLGIHTHGDGIIHIHPFVSGSAGANAKLGLFLDDTGATVTNTKITLPSGDTFEEGTDQCAGKDAIVLVAYWRSADDAAAGEKPTTVFTDDFGDIRFKEDRAAFTIAFLPEGADIPAPPSIPTLDNLTDVGTNSAPGGSTTTFPGGATTTTLPGSESTTTVAGGTSSTAPGDTSGSTTTAPNSSTPTSG